MKILQYISLCLCLISTTACASLRPATHIGETSLIGYKYAYITQTDELSSSSGSVYGNQFVVYGSTVTKSVNPANVISGILMKNGLTIIPEITDEIRDRTIIVNYGETGRRNVFWGYTIEITLQILSADTHEVLCTCTAEGMGETEADDIRIAITRALKTIFPN